MPEDGLTDEIKEEIVSACRTTIGDELRSVTYFTPDTVEQLYLREDLAKAADLVGFAENERLGFLSQATYDHTELGDYLFTVRVFDHGFLTRVIVGEMGVFLSADELHIDRFEEVGAAIRAILRDVE